VQDKLVALSGRESWSEIKALVDSIPDEYLPMVFYGLPEQVARVIEKQAVDASRHALLKNPAAYFAGTFVLNLAREYARIEAVMAEREYIESIGGDPRTDSVFSLADGSFMHVQRPDASLPRSGEYGTSRTVGTRTYSGPGGTSTTRTIEIGPKQPMQPFGDRVTSAARRHGSAAVDMGSRGASGARQTAGQAVQQGRQAAGKFIEHLNRAAKQPPSRQPQKRPERRR
jgi:hypothetical protein